MALTLSALGLAVLALGLATRWVTTHVMGIHGGARSLLDELGAARASALAKANEIRAEIRRREGLPVHRVRILPTDDEIWTFRKAQVLLDLAWENGVCIPSACGGCAECGTCRVRVLEGLDRLPPRSPKEKKTLAMYTNDPTVRLACLLRVNADLKVSVEVDQDQFPVVVPPRRRVA